MSNEASLPMISNRMKKNFRSIFAMLILMSPVLGVFYWIYNRNDRKLSLVIMAGQSNMSGRGALPKSPPPPLKNVFVFGNDDQWHPAIEPLDSEVNQVDLISEDRNPGFSPGTAFAQSIIEKRPDILIGLIPCAKGGSAIEEWQKNSERTSLYGSCLRRIKIAEESGSVVAMLFYQGETDALDFTNAAKWASRFSRFVDDIRADLENSNLPIVFTHLPYKNGEEYVAWEVVKAQQEIVKISNTALVKTVDLTLFSNAHLDTQSHVVLGKRYADALNALDVNWKPYEKSYLFW